MKKIRIIILFIYFVMFGLVPCVFAASKNAELGNIVFPIVINIFCTALLLYQQSIFNEELEKIKNEELEKIKHKLGIKDEDIY